MLFLFMEMRPFGCLSFATSPSKSSILRLIAASAKVPSPACSSSSGATIVLSITNP